MSVKRRVGSWSTFNFLKKECCFRVRLRVREIWNGKLILTAERRSKQKNRPKKIYTLTNCPIFRSENKPSSEARRKMRITLKSKKKKNENETKRSLQITIWKCDDKNNGLLLVQKTRWYHISVSFVTSIYSGLGLRLVSSRFNDKNAFSKLKKISRFQLYVRAYVCIWTYTAPGLTILFLTRSAIGYCSHSNRKRPLLKFLNDREACQEKVGSGSLSTFF